MKNGPSTLQLEIRQNRPFSSASQEGVLGLLRTADVIRRVLARVLEPFEVTPQQYNVLRILRGAGCQGLPTLSIGERMLEEAPGVTRLIDRLEAKGLVHRERSPQDRRQVLCWLTPEGQDLVARIDGPMEEADGAALAMLTQEDQIQLIRLLDAIRAGHRSL